MAKKTLAKTEKAIKRAAMANAAMFQFQKNKASGHQFLPEFYARRREILFRGVLLITYDEYDLKFLAYFQTSCMGIYL